MPVPPIAAPRLLLFLTQVALLLLLAVLLGRLAGRLRLPAVVGELCAGVLLGPSLLAHALPTVSGWLLPRDPDQFHLLDAVGQLGVLLLVGVTGIHLDVRLLRRQRRTAALVSACGLAVPLALGVGCGFLLPAALMAEGTDRMVFAAFLGVALCVSAIPVIARTLIDLNLFHHDLGQLILTAAIVDDTVGWLLLSVVAGMAATDPSAGTAALSVLGVLVVLVAATLLRPAVGWLLRSATRAEAVHPGHSVGAVVVALILLSSAATHALGLEAVLGAFVCGVVIASTGIDLARLASLRAMVLSVLAPVFFASAGLRMDLTALGRPAVLGAALLVLAVAIVGKFAGAYLGAVLGGLNRWEALALGAGLNARGVIEVIIAMVGLRLGVLTTAAYTIVVLVALTTSLLAPPLLRVAFTRIRPPIDSSHDQCHRHSPDLEKQ